MTAEEAVRLRLLAISALTALVSTRVHLEKLPQSPTYPCVRVSLIAETGAGHLRGADALKSALVQVDAFAKELSGIDPYALVVAVSDAIHGDDAGSGLSGWSDQNGSPSLGVQGCQRETRRRPTYDPDELRVLMMSQDYRVWFQA